MSQLIARLKLLAATTSAVALCMSCGQNSPRLTPTQPNQSVLPGADAGSADAGFQSDAGTTSFEPASAATYVAKVKNPLLGLPPTDTEVLAVTADPTQLKALVNDWKLCYYANSAPCIATDPEFQRLVTLFQNSGFAWNTLVAELFSSPIVTHASDTQTADVLGEVVTADGHGCCQHCSTHAAASCCGPI